MTSTRRMTEERGQHSERGTAFAGGLIGLLLLVLLATPLFCGWVLLQRVDRLYQGHIYPEVYALELDLGGKTSEEAARALHEAMQEREAGSLVLIDGDRQWSYAWSEAGLQLDVATMVQQAYAVGRSGEWQGQLEGLLDSQEIEPRFLFDATTARALLDGLAADVSQPPVEPPIHLQRGEVVIGTGEPGRVLNVTNTLARLQEAGGTLERVEIPLEFSLVEPMAPDTTGLTAQIETLLGRRLVLSAYDVLTDETFTWTVAREALVSWLHLAPGPDGEAQVDVNLHAIRQTLTELAGEMGSGRGFRYDEAAQQVLALFDAGGGSLELYLSHPVRTYTVQAGDTLTNIARRFEMPPGLVFEANRDIDLDRLQVGQQVTIPSQDVLTPHIPVPGKHVVVNIDEQRMRVYEQGALLHEWPVSTGLEDSPTHRGTFQVIAKDELAYASQWELRMPYFITIYPAGGSVDNGIHELPINRNGQRLWEGHLGRPASYGCIILGIPQAETLFDWVEIGVLVIVE